MGRPYAGQTMSHPRAFARRTAHATLVLGLAAALLGGCVDFGYEIFDAGFAPDAAPVVLPPGQDAGPEPTNPDAGASAECVEGPTDPTTDGPQLRYASLAVDQRVLNIAVGDVVTWTNGDTMRHSVVAGAPGAELPLDRGGFNSGELAPGGTFAVRFCRARTVIYFCATHPSQMNNFRIVVE